MNIKNLLLKYFPATIKSIRADAIELEQRSIRIELFMNGSQFHTDSLWNIRADNIKNNWEPHRIQIHLGGRVYELKIEDRGTFSNRITELLSPTAPPDKQILCTQCSSRHSITTPCMFK